MTPGRPFRRLRARATLAAATQFRHAYYGRQVRLEDRREPLTWASVPEDYDAQIRALRRARGLSQGQLAAVVGAARKSRRLPMGSSETHPVAAVLATTRRAPRVRSQPFRAPFAKPNGAGKLSTMRTVSTLTWTFRRIAAIRSHGLSNHQMDRRLVHRDGREHLFRRRWRRRAVLWVTGKTSPPLRLQTGRAP